MENEIQNGVNPQLDPTPVVDPSTKTDANTGAPDVSNTEVKNPTANPGVANKGSEVQPSGDVFEKRFKDMERKFTKAAQERASFFKERETLQSQLSSMQQALQSLTKKPYSPEQFIRDLEQKGPEALTPLLEERMGAFKDAAAKEKSEMVERIQTLEMHNELNYRRGDAEKYPDFRKLEVTMQEVWESEDSGIDPNQPIGTVLDKLYELAKSRHSTDAVKAAEQAGYNKATKELAKESATTVAGGGKASGTALPDLQKMSAKQIRDLLSSMNGVVDRD